MKYTKKRSQNKRAAEKREATWEKFKHQQNTLATNKRGDRLRGMNKSKY